MASAIGASAALSVGTLSGCASLRQQSKKSHCALPVQPRPALLKSGGLRAATSSQALAQRTHSLVAPFKAKESRSSGSNLPPKGPRAAGQAYICQDCGYIYDGRKAFDTLPREYQCPVCSAPKRRFKPYTAPVRKDANKLDVRKARKAELQSSGNPLPAVIGGIAIVLVGTYLYLNSTL